MSTPTPNPFLMFRTAQPFFPGFAPYGFPAFMPQNMHPTNIPMFFSKNPMEMACGGGPEMTSPISAFDQKLQFGFLNGEASNSQAYDKVKEKEMAFQSEEKLKKEPLLQVSEGEEDESRSSLDIKMKLEDEKSESKSEDQNEMKREPESDSQSDKGGKGANTSVAWYPEFSLTYECIFSFFFSSLDDHLVGAHHFKQDEFQCKQCTVRFCHRPLLIKHEAISHNNIRKYSCENCSKVSLTHNSTHNLTHYL